MRRSVILLSLLVSVAGSVLCIRAAGIDTFSGKIISIGDKTIEIRGKEGEQQKFQIEKELVQKARLSKGQEVTVFYTPKDKHVTGIQVGDEIWHQKECSREDCVCKNYNCKPSCKCKKQAG